MRDYEDMLDMPHHVSVRHPQMARPCRAAQFAPFAALSGYEDVIQERGRCTEQRIELLDEGKALLDDELGRSGGCVLKLTFFVKDPRKDGGRYDNATGRIRRMDKGRDLIIMDSGTRIRISDVVSVERAGNGAE